MRTGCLRDHSRLLLAAAATLVLASPTPTAGAQAAPRRAIEIRPYIGSLQPLDDRSRWFLGGSYTGVQVAVEFPRRVHLVSSVAWTYTDNQFLTNQATDIWHADLGLEVGPRRRIGERWEVHPYIGAGGGVRLYDYRDPQGASAAFPTGYVSAALELRSERVGIRGDTRLFGSRFQPPVTGDQRTRYDVVISLGIAYHLVRRGGG